MSQETNARREFLKVAGATVASAGVAGSALAQAKKPTPAKSNKFAVAPSRVIGANDRIGIGIIGVGGQGNNHHQTLKRHRQELNHTTVAVCDVYQNRLEAAVKSADNPEVKGYKNYQDLLKDPRVDVVFIATPEHWHARQTLDTLKAGKDIYLEKPMTRYLEEGIAVYRAVKASDRIVQIGSQGCSDAKWHTAGQVVKSGRIGHKVWSQGSYCRNNQAGEWNYRIDPALSPANLDWAMWLGPAPKVPFSPERYSRWRKYWDYSGGILTDLFPHKLNPFMIALGAEWPSRVACTGGIYMDTDTGNNPDRQVADTTHMLVDYPSGHTILVAGSTINETGLNEMIRGHKANVLFGGNGVEVRPERPFADEVDVERVPLIENDDIRQGEDIAQHQRNFLRSVRSRQQPNCPVDIAAPVQVAINMAELAYKNNKQVQFDPKTLKIIP
ncbi:MAG: Gfo/Idh/MocA family oxidoreductase [Armatimonadetes bacterium]|nr:Gfo/Idh/MocA family oxidoreductase [Armatimonadota bacterium]